MKKVNVKYFTSLLFILVFFNACTQNTEKKNSTTLDSITLNIDSFPYTTTEKTGFDTIASGLNFVPGANYNQTKIEIIKQKEKLYNNYSLIPDSSNRNIYLDSISNIFANNILNEILPYWYGTPWDFEGYTSKPNDGKIACGYLVSTTLRDAGLNLNRYKLAQQGPQNEARSIAMNTENLFLFKFNSFENNVIHELYKLNEGLYFIGLDNHVGYVYIKNKEIYFIHSNYILGKVMVEIAENSEAFKSTQYHISNISHNRSLILSWLQNEELTIISE